MSPLYPPSRPMPISQVLDSSFRLFKASVVRCLAFGPLWIIVGQAPNIYHLAIGRPRQAFGGSDPIWWALYLVGALGSIAISAALVTHQRDIVSGVASKATLKMAEAVRRLPAIVGLTIGVMLIIATPLGLVMLGVYQGEFALQGLGMVVIFGALAVYITYVGLALSLAWSALLLDGMSPVASMRYSLNLVRGNWWRTMVIFTVAFVVVFVIYLVMATVVFPIAGAMDIAIVTAVTEVLIVALSALVAPYFSATMLALYGDLRARKEGTDLEQRISAAART